MEDSEGEATGGVAGDSFFAAVVGPCDLPLDPCVEVVDTVVERAKVLVRAPLGGVLVGEEGNALFIVELVG